MKVKSLKTLLKSLKSIRVFRLLSKVFNKNCCCSLDVEQQQ